MFLPYRINKKACCNGQTNKAIGSPDVFFKLHMSQIFLDRQSYSIGDLQRKLSFTFLPYLDFESQLEKEEIRKKIVSSVDFEGKEARLGTFFRQEIETGFISPVWIQWVSEKVGYGLLSCEKIKKKSFVGEYTGLVRKNNRRYTEPLNHYCYHYPVQDSVGRNYVIDATQGHLTRFMNHNPKPNLEPKFAFLNGFYHLIFLAAREIEPGEQLTYDYGETYWQLRERPVLDL